MQIKLIDHTQNAIDKLIYAKLTRLGRDARQAKLDAMSDDDKMEELEYMSKTIPSSWEFVTYTFEISDVTRAFTHQFVRTRQASYAQQTMRVLAMDQFGYMIPDSLENDQEAKELYKSCMVHTQRYYDALIQRGVPIEDARGVLPTNIHTNIIAQFNLRTLSEMAKSRTGGRTQSEYRQVMDLMVEAMLEVHPWVKMFLFQDKKEHFDKMEQLVRLSERMGLFDEGLHDKADFLKAIDKLRKG